MKESNTLADNVVIRHLQREILLNIKGVCMKESNSLADNVVMRHLQLGIFQSIKGLYMKESGDVNQYCQSNRRSNSMGNSGTSALCTETCASAFVY